MKLVKDYTIEELNLAWNETMWDIDNLRESIQDCLREDVPSIRYEELYSDAQQKIAELNQEYIRRGIDTPDED